MAKYKYGHLAVRQHDEHVFIGAGKKHGSEMDPRTGERYVYKKNFKLPRRMSTQEFHEWMPKQLDDETSRLSKLVEQLKEEEGIDE